MAIEFTCASCSNLVRTPDSAAGKKGRCPYCQAVVQIPSASAPQSPTPILPPPAEMISFTCRICGKPAKAPKTMAGRKGRCPNCKGVIGIPEAGSAATLSASAPPAATKPKDKPVLQPLGVPTPGLQPLGAPGLQPLGPVGGLQPLGPAPGLQPLGPATSGPFGGGLQPLGGPPSAGPFGGLQPLAGPGPYGGPSPFGAPPANPFGDPGFGAPAMSHPLAGPTLASKNPYSSPGASSYTPQLDDPRSRRGLPWQREQDFDAFSATVKQVLFGFPNCFRRMRVEGGIGSAMGFAVCGNVASVIAIALFNFVLQMILSVFMVAGAPDERGVGVAGFVILFSLLMLLVYVVVGGIMAAIGAMIGSFLMAGMYHLCLLVVGGANRGFETTYQVGCYSTGAVAMLSAIPIVGIFITLFLFPVILIFGLMHAHCTSGLRATLAVLLPYMLCVGFVGFMVVVALLPLIFGR